MYSQWAISQGKSPKPGVIRALTLKPIRTLSGVAPVTVLTKPYPCPGKCIFCPNDIRMPKSYLSQEPGAQRAEKNYFDPFLQTTNRLEALESMGHPVDKIELIILGGTWSFYPESYQIWFIHECFRALNQFNLTPTLRRQEIEAREKIYEQAATQLNNLNLPAQSNLPQQNQLTRGKFAISGMNLAKRYNQIVTEQYQLPEEKVGLAAWQVSSWENLITAQIENEVAKSRCVGLVIETRPDHISEAEVERIRRLGATKVQIGVQSLNDEVLTKNHRGHTVAATKKAFALLRRAGFKIHAHWMANLYGSSVAADQQDYDQLWSDPAFKPDELKVYPCSLIESAELMQYFQKGLWKPYSQAELLEVVSHCLVSAPRYTRLTRIIRDIPSTDIVIGNKFSNFRQIAEKEVVKSGSLIQEIRAREIRSTQFDVAQAAVAQTVYNTSVSQEYFIEVLVPTSSGEKILGFLRLSLPTVSAIFPELNQSAIIREIHVYGQLTELTSELDKALNKTAQNAQHGGWGQKLILIAAQIAKSNGYQNLAVISAIGTRAYYRKRGFIDGNLFQQLNLNILHDLVKK